MTKRNKILSVFIAIFLFINVATLFIFPSMVLADCGGASTSIINCESNDESGDALFEVIKIAIKFLTTGILIVAVGATIYGGIIYSTSGSAPDKINQARSIWLNTVIGLIVYAFLVAITNFLIPGGIFK